MNTLWQDLRYGARMLLKTPAVTLVAVIALTLGIGANTALFSVVNAVLLRSLPYADGERLAIVWEHRKSGAGNAQNVINLGNFYDWKDQNSVFVDMAAFFDRNVNLTSDGEPEEVAGQIATTNLFSVLGVNASQGRTFAADDGKPGGPNVVVISHNLWQRRFGGGQVVGHAQGGCSLRRLRRRRRARRTGGRPSRRRARVAPVTGPSRNPVVNARVPARCSGPRWLSAGERSG